MGVVLVLFLFLGLFSPSDASTGSHSLQYFYMGVSSPVPVFPEFYVAGYVDDKQISWYDSMSQQDEPRALWMEENESPEYWIGQTWFSTGAQQVFKHNMKTLEERFNQSEVQPSVTVWNRKSEGHSFTLHCLVTGFYPREIEVKWMKNGTITMQGTAATDILPNHDGTYQIQESVEIDPQEEASYSCQVDHSSLPESRNEPWAPHRAGSWTSGSLVSCSTVTLMIILGLAAVLI